MEQVCEWVGNTLVSIGKLAETSHFSFVFLNGGGSLSLEDEISMLNSSCSSVC